MSHVIWAKAMISMDALTHARWKMGSFAQWRVALPEACAPIRALSSFSSSAFQNNCSKTRSRWNSPPLSICMPSSPSTPISSSPSMTLTSSSPPSPSLMEHFRWSSPMTRTSTRDPSNCCSSPPLLMTLGSQPLWNPSHSSPSTMTILSSSTTTPMQNTVLVKPSTSLPSESLLALH